ncbi:exodeoxyribonuclease VII large subunit [Comamonas composti]|uniref:exodeoxyribonuclease VII large subunit n=1 Tax=Comamonas composti TaxID=408558 RepID=UPI0004023CDC|nr:exodeoxyribonuclease VII large subunit [Comamonas composti]
MNSGFGPLSPASSPLVWEVGALCKAIGDALQARFNPVAVRGEISGFSRAASGHCYFNLKDSSGQIRCAMFRRAAQLMDFSPRDGELVELRGRLGVYEQRGDLQLVVESMQRAGQGALFEQFLRLKASLQAQGLFDEARKRSLPRMPRGIGLVTSLGAAALHDVVTALRRRVPHIPVVLAPALVQGPQAPASLIAALQKLYALGGAERTRSGDEVHLDCILLVRGGGSLEDLWAFNDEQLAHTIVQSPVPLISGIGHETDFCIADFCADLRAPTPTAAAELLSQPREVWLGALGLMQQRLSDGVQRQLDRQQQRLDSAVQRLGRPSEQLVCSRNRLDREAQRLRHAMALGLQVQRQKNQWLAQKLPQAAKLILERREQHLMQLQLRLQLLDPRLILQRGYALLTDADGRPVTEEQQAPPGTALRAQLAKGSLDLTVTPPRLL